jgi:DNA-binding NtrC family response regulator
MGNAFRPTALVVEDDTVQRSLVTLLLEESDMDVVTCASAEDALVVLDKIGYQIAMLFTDVELAGPLDGIELAHRAKERFPDMRLIVTSGSPGVRRLPDGSVFMAKPWAPLQLLREAARTTH